jgi:molybdopterin-guanine dinucleotide biosynthesis protein A
LASNGPADATASPRASYAAPTSEYDCMNSRYRFGMTCLDMTRCYRARRFPRSSRLRYVDSVMVEQAFLLTGGRSRRMGTDKALLDSGGVPMALRIAREIAGIGIPVTVLGREPLPGFEFIRDAEEFGGPLKALAGARPLTADTLVCSCDLPLFDGRLVARLAALRAGHAAAVPHVDGRPQPLCAVYGAEAFVKLREVRDAGSERIMDWLRTLRVRYVSEREIADAGLDPRCVRGVNSPGELERLVGRNAATVEGIPGAIRDLES